MVVVRCYPSVVDSNPGVWTNPTRALGPSELPIAKCAFKSTNSAGDFRLYLKTFLDTSSNPFNIPAGATITRETIGIRGGYNPNFGIGSEGFWVGWLIFGIMNWFSVPAPSFPFSPDCNDDLIWQSFDIPSGFWMTIAQLNGGSYTTYANIIWAPAGGGGVLAQVDAVYIEVEYTVPSAVQARGDGLVWIVAAAHAPRTIFHNILNTGSTQRLLEGKHEHSSVLCIADRGHLSH